MKKSNAFTIVELLIVIVVIAILAAISIVAYNGVQNRARESTLKSDLTNAAKQMELANVDAGNYPTTLPSGVKPSSNVVMSLSQSTNGFCINAEQGDSLKWRYDSTNGGLQEGVCSGSIISGSESGSNPNLITDTNFNQLGINDGQWRIFRSTGTTAGVTRNGTSTDPYPTRRVLQLSNTANSATTWNAMGGTYVNSGIITGRTYLTSYYVRLATGTINNNTIAYFGVQDGGATNTVLSVGASPVIPTSQWQKVSRTGVAAQAARPSSIIYFHLQGSAIRDNNFTLEFQGFELREL